MPIVGAVEFWSNVISAIAWPLAAVALVFMYRVRIETWMKAILAKASGSVTAGPVRAEWTGDAATAMSDAGEQLVESAGLDIEARITASGAVHDGDAPTPVRAEAERDRALVAEEARRKENVEALIGAAARWGWDQRSANIFSGFPTPIVEWDADRPYVLAGKVTNPGDIVTTPQPDGSFRTRTIRDQPEMLMPPGD